MKKWAGRLIKTCIVIAIIIALVLTVMVNMGGNSDTLKGAIEDYLMSSTRYSAEIETLHKMTFFPNIGANIEGLEMKNPEDELQVIRIQNANIALGFWDLMLGDRSIRAFQIKNAVFAPGTLMRQTTTIDELGIDEDANGRAFLTLDGKIGDQKISGNLDLESSGSIKKRKYKIGEESKIAITLESLNLSGVLKPRAVGGFHFKDFMLTHNDAQVLSGSLSFLRDSNPTPEISFKGNLKSAETDAETQIDGTLSFANPIHFNGDLDAAYFTTKDFTKGSRLMNAIGQWNKSMALSETPPMELNVNLSADKFENDGALKTDYQTTIIRKAGVLSFNQAVPESQETKTP